MEAINDVDSEYVCKVCGDSATGYRFYGASPVCYSCRIFFRRVVTSKQTFQCTNGPESAPCIIERVSRNHCKRCRFDKCINIGLLPYLVNSNNRKNHNSVAEAVNHDTSDGGGVIKHSVAKTNNIAPVAPYRIPEKSFQLKVIVTPNVFEDKKYICPDNFQVDLAVKKMEIVFDDVFFNFDSKAYHIKLLEMDNFCIEQIRQGKEIIKTPPEMWGLAFDLLWNVVHQVLKSYLPESEASVMKTITDNVILTLSGLELCIFDIFPSRNLLEQWLNSCSYFNSERLSQFYRATFPDIETLEPMGMDRYDLFVSPYAKSVEDETFISCVRRKMKQLLDNDEHLGRTSNIQLTF